MPFVLGGNYIVPQTFCKYFGIITRITAIAQINKSTLSQVGFKFSFRGKKIQRLQYFGLKRVKNEFDEHLSNEPFHFDQSHFLLQIYL